MKNYCIKLGAIAFTTALLAVGSAQVGSLKIGDPAPEFRIGKWVKDGGFNKLEKNKIYVIDFWATRCGPCVAAIPHLSGLAREYRGKAEFIGISIQKWPTGGQNDTLEILEKFMEMRGNDEMDYNVAADTEEGFMAKNWFGPAGLSSIPQIFIVDKNGKIAWIGTPKYIDDVLAKVVSGVTDYSELQQGRNADLQRKQDMAVAADALGRAVREGEYETAKKDGAKYVKLYPESAFIHCSYIQALIKTGEQKKALTLIQTTLANNPSAALCLSLTSQIMYENEFKGYRDYDLVIEGLHKYLGQAEARPNIYTMMAEAYFAKKDYEKAVEYQKKALEMMPASSPRMEQTRRINEDILRDYEKAAQRYRKD